MKKQFENFLKTKTFLILYLIQPVSSRKREATEGEWGRGGALVWVSWRNRQKELVFSNKRMNLN